MHKTSRTANLIRNKRVEDLPTYLLARSHGDCGWCGEKVVNGQYWRVTGVQDIYVTDSGGYIPLFNMTKDIPFCNPNCVDEYYENGRNTP